MALDCIGSHAERCKIYPDYKKKEEKPGEDFCAQERIIYELVGQMEIPLLTCPGWEADDVLATVARKLSGDGLNVVIVGMDKDLLQCVSERVVMYNPAKKEVWNVARVITEKGVEPWRWADVQALMGDPTDNVPGVPGVGPITAAKLIQKYETVENVFANCGELPDRLHKKLEGYQSQVMMARELTRLHSSLSIGIPVSRFIIDENWKARVASFLKVLGFRSLMGQVSLLS